MHILTALALLPTAAFAFSQTYPLLAWSSHKSSSLSLASSKSSDFLESILKSSDICSHDAIVFVDQVDLHAADLRTLPSSGALANALESAAASLQFPYVRRTTGVNPFDELADALAQRCGARLVHVGADEDEVTSSVHGSAKEKHVVCMEMPSLESTHGAMRKSMMANHDLHLSSALAALARTHPHNLVLYSGWSRSVATRQSSPNPFAPAKASQSADTFAPSGGILARYQLFTPALLLGLILVLGVLVPLILLGVSALASVQSPVRNEPPKQWISADKKNQ